jgi:hypothetical protein
LLLGSEALPETDGTQPKLKRFKRRNQAIYGSVDDGWELQNDAMSLHILWNDFHKTRIQWYLLFQLYFNVDLCNFYAADIMLYLIQHNMVELLNHWVSFSFILWLHENTHNLCIII